MHAGSRSAATHICTNCITAAQPHLTRTEFCNQLDITLGPRFHAPLALLRTWTYSAFYLVAEMWGSIGEPAGTCRPGQEPGPELWGPWGLPGPGGSGSPMGRNTQAGLDTGPWQAPAGGALTSRSAINLSPYRLPVRPTATTPTRILLPLPLPPPPTPPPRTPRHTPGAALAVVSLLFWGLANSVMTVDEAATFYPLFGMGANLSLIVAGGVTERLSKLRASLPPGVDGWVGGGWGGAGRGGAGRGGAGRGGAGWRGGQRGQGWGRGRVGERRGRRAVQGPGVRGCTGAARGGRERAICGADGGHRSAARPLSPPEVRLVAPPGAPLQGVALQGLMGLVVLNGIIISILHWGMQVRAAAREGAAAMRAGNGTAKAHSDGRAGG